MKVICIMDFIHSPLAEVKGTVKEGEIYTVKGEHYGYSQFAKRYVDAYAFYEVEGYYEKSIFIPLSDTDNKVLTHEKETIQQTT